MKVKTHVQIKTVRDIIWLSSPYLPASKLGYFGVSGLGLGDFPAIIRCLEGLVDRYYWIFQLLLGVWRG